MKLIILACSIGLVLAVNHGHHGHHHGHPGGHIACSGHDDPSCNGCLAGTHQQCFESVCHCIPDSPAVRAAAASHITCSSAADCSKLNCTHDAYCHKIDAHHSTGHCQCHNDNYCADDTECANWHHCPEGAFCHLHHNHGHAGGHCWCNDHHTHGRRAHTCLWDHNCHHVTCPIGEIPYCKSDHGLAASLCGCKPHSHVVRQANIACNSTSDCSSLPNCDHGAHCYRPHGHHHHQPGYCLCHHSDRHCSTATECVNFNNCQVTIICSHGRCHCPDHHHAFMS